MYVKHELTIDEMTDFLWGAAREKWVDATGDQRRMVWDRLEDSFYKAVPEDVTVNDAVAYDCNDIFFPEDEDDEEYDEDDEEYDESLKRNKLESRIKRLEKLMLRK